MKKFNQSFLKLIGFLPHQFCSAMALVFLLSACANQVVWVNKQFVRDLPNLEDTQHFFFWGWGTVVKVLDPIAVCGSVTNLVRIERSYEPLNALYTGITLGIYMPQTIRIYCRK